MLTFVTFTITIITLTLTHILVAIGVLFLVLPILLTPHTIRLCPKWSQRELACIAVEFRQFICIVRMGDSTREDHDRLCGEYMGFVTTPTPYRTSYRSFAKALYPIAEKLLTEIDIDGKQQLPLRHFLLQLLRLQGKPDCDSPKRTLQLYFNAGGFYGGIVRAIFFRDPKYVGDFYEIEKLWIIFQVSVRVALPDTVKAL